jgi:hypothetical protein
MITHRLSFLSFGAALVVSAPSVLVAAPIDGRVRLGLETNVLSYEKTTLSAGGTETTHSGTSFGVGGAGFGVGIGVGLGENWLLGGRALYSNDTESAGGGAPATTTSSIGISITPEYVLDGDAVRPFLGVSLGHRAISAKSSGQDASTSLTFVGPSVGLHWFATGSFSIDPNLQVLYETGGRSLSGVDLSESGYAILAGASLSGWLGGGAPTPPTGAGEPAPSNEDVRSSGDLSPTPATAPPVAPDPSQIAEFHDLHMTIPLGGPTRLLLTADPEGAASVEIVLVAGDSEELRECNALTAESPKGTVAFGPFAKKEVGAGTGALLALSTRAPLSAVRALGKGKGSLVLEGCEQSFELTEKTREVMGRFALAVRKSARARERENAESADLSAATGPLSSAAPPPAANGSLATRSHSH